VRLVPKKRHRLLGHVLDRPIRVVIAIGTGKDDDPEFHVALSF
jgi:hypothetical protein